MAKAKTLEQVKAIINGVHFMDRSFALTKKGDGFLLQVQYMEKDIHSGKPEVQRARKWYVSSFATETEIVETAFKACRVSMDHVLKEHFLYCGLRVYSPHFHILGRMRLCSEQVFDSREPPEETS
jgi:hypothetical protein